MSIQEAKAAFKRAHPGRYSVGIGKTQDHVLCLVVMCNDDAQFPAEFEGYPVEVVRARDLPKKR